MINGTQNQALPREHEEAAPAADTSRQHDPALCPTWCNGQHLHKVAASEDFHHDGESKTLVPANQQQHDVDEYVSVFPLQFVDSEGVTHAPLVELFVGEKGCRLTPLEAIGLGRNLMSVIEELLSAPEPVTATRVTVAAAGPHCPSWCAGAHPDTSFDHGSAPLGTFTATHAETETPEPGTVYTGAFRDEVTVGRRKVVLEVPRDCFGWTWLDAEQARRVAGFLVAAAEQLEADRG